MRGKSGLFPGRGVNRTGKTGKSWERTGYAPEKGSEKGTFSEEGGRKNLFPNRGLFPDFFRDFFRFITHWERTFSGFSGKYLPR